MKAKNADAVKGRETLTMVEAIAMLKTTRPTFYRWLRAGRIKGMKMGRQWRFYREDVNRFLEGQGPRVDLTADIGPLIAGLEAQLTTIGVSPVAVDEADAVTRAVRLMIVLAYHSGASDLHLDSLSAEGRVRVRVDGQMHELTRVDRRLMPALFERWKSMAQCDVNNHVNPQDGRIALQMPVGKKGGSEREIVLRICFLPALTGESLSAQLLDSATGAASLDAIAYAPDDRARLDEALDRGTGLVVVTGPVGSGITSVLYACLQRLNTPERTVITVEDPVVFQMDGVCQVPVRPQFGMTFPMVLRAVLRSDADAILIGEIRDRESLMVGIQAALVGRLVLTGLHAEDAATALVRLLDISAEPFVIAETASLALSQRLVRRVCPHCAEPVELPEELAAIAAQTARDGGLSWDDLDRKFVRAGGCARCMNVGYRGRMPIAETLRVTTEIRKALRRKDGADQLRCIAIAEGMTTMGADGVRRAAAGETTMEEVVRMLGLRSVGA